MTTNEAVAGSLLGMVRVALREPMAPGVNVTVKVVALPGVTGLVGGVVTLKSPALDPPGVIVPNVRFDAPLFLITKLFEDAVSARTGPKFKGMPPLVKAAPAGCSTAITAGSAIQLPEVSIVPPAPTETRSPFAYIASNREFLVGLVRLVQLTPSGDVKIALGAASLDVKEGVMGSPTAINMPLAAETPSKPPFVGTV